MMTGRGSLDINGVGIGHNQTENHDSGGTLHDNNGSYTHSIFDVAKDGGHRTVLFANKSKFALFERTWDGTWSNPGENNSGTSPRTSTFAVLDHILDALTKDRSQYPNLEEVVLVGHGDGANLLQRYAASNNFEPDFKKSRKLPVRYVLLAPDNFMFFNRERPTENGNFAVPDSPPDNFNDYPYGTNYLFEYLNTTGIDNLLDNYPVREVAYLVGAKDKSTDNLDNSPAAQIQGQHRKDRVQAYAEHLQQMFGPTILDNHAFTTLPSIGFQADMALKTSEASKYILGIHITDSDGDGFLDSDERALATDPYDSENLPSSFANSYSLANGDGDNHNSVLEIRGSQLFTNATFNHETQDKLNIRIRATDPGGLSFEQTFTLTVTDAPDAPTQIQLTNNAVDENLKKGATVGYLSAIDEDVKDKHSFQLIDSEDISQNDRNSLFVISGNKLRTNAVLDFDQTPKLDVLIGVTDLTGLQHSQKISIIVTDANDTPTGVNLDSKTIAENQPAGTEIGTLVAVDPDLGDSHTYKISGGADKKYFSIKGDKLVSNGPYDFETKDEYEVVIRTYDKKKAFADTKFAINVTNLNDPPTGISLSNNSVAENEPLDTLVGTLSVFDPEKLQIVKVTAGKHSLFLMNDGSLWSMGDNSSGQLGDGTTDNRTKPIRVVESGVIGIAAGVNHSLFVKVDGSLWAMGQNSSGQLGNGSNENSLTLKKS